MNFDDKDKKYSYLKGALGNAKSAGAGSETLTAQSDTYLGKLQAPLRWSTH